MARDNKLDNGNTTEEASLKDASSNESVQPVDAETLAGESVPAPLVEEEIVPAPEPVINQGEAGRQPNLDDLRGTTANKEPVKPTETVATGGGGLVPIKVKDYTKCRIGVKYYEFKPGGIYRVPKNVKEVLQEAGKLGVL